MTFFFSLCARLHTFSQWIFFKGYLRELTRLIVASNQLTQLPRSIG